MPRQQREAAPVVPVSRGRAGVRLTSLLVIILVSSTAGAWYFGGQATEATTTAKQVISVASANVQKVTLQANGQAVTFEPLSVKVVASRPSNQNNEGVDTSVG
jgi:uncharacterized protein (UPF0333 family)